MRVAYVISTLERCGPVNVLFDIVSNLGDGFEAAVFTLAKEPATSRAADFERIGCKVVCACNSRVVSMLAGKKLLVRALRDFAPDVVHAHGFRAYLVCEGLSTPTVATVHNCIYEDFLTSYGERRARWMTEKELAALRRFDAVVACSESNASYLRREYGLKCDSVRNGVDQRRFLPLATGRRGDLRNELGIEPGTLTVVATGGCSERKGTLPLASGFPSVLARVPFHSGAAKAELHVFGEGPLYTECRGLGLENVTFHGFSPDVVPWLQAADLFVSASRSEGMPLAVLEALSCGCPALLSDIAPHREIAGAVHGQSCVRLFDATNEESCAEGLAGALASLPARPADVLCFGAAQMVEGYRTVYEAVLG